MSAAPSLAELQLALQTAVLQLDETAPEFIRATPQAGAEQGFQVYCDAYRLRLIEALSADYPALQAWLGEEGFGRLGRAYIDARPSDQFSIRWFGRHLPAFLLAEPAYAGQNLVRELAGFEWALSEAFDEADSAVAAYPDLAGIASADWPTLKLRFHPSLRRIDLHSNATQVWLAANEKQSWPEAQLADQPQSWIIWRQELKLLFRSLLVAEAYALDAFRAGQNFADVCGGLCGLIEEGQVAAQVAGFLQAWLRDGWITGIA